MRQSKAKSIRREAKKADEMQKFGSIKTVNRRVKRFYNQTPRPERESFTIFERRKLS